jgi:hypothetical protein
MPNSKRRPPTIKGMSELEQDEIDDECLPALEIDLVQRIDLHA